MSVKIGDLRQRITFQDPVKSDDGHGGHIVSGWNDIATVWAKVEPLKGREYFYAHQIKAEVSHRVTIRYRTGLTVEMRIKFGIRYLKMESIIDLKELHEFMEIFCNEEK